MCTVGKRAKEAFVVGRTDYHTVLRHVLARDLQPTTGGSTKIDAASCRLEERVLLVQLDELEG